MIRSVVSKLFGLLLSVALLSTMLPSIALAAAEPVVTAFTDSGTVFANPYMGFAPEASGGPYAEPHSLVFTYLSWKDIEPTKGVYDFTTFEKVNKFTYWKSLGVKMIFRIHADFPGQSDHLDIPQWLYNETADGTHYKNSYGMGYSPNYGNQTYIAAHKRLILAMASRYNNDPFIAEVEIGSVGHWGEWHTYKGSDSVVPFPSQAICDQYAQPYVDGFTNKKLVMRRPTQIGLNNNMSLFNDNIGDYDQVYTWFLDWTKNGYRWWLTGESMPAMPNYWQNAPVGGESMLGFTNTLSDANVQGTMQQVADLRLSYWKTSDTAYASLASTVKARIATLKKRMGYRFLISSSAMNADVAAGSSLNIGFTMQNSGVAPFYFNWPLRIALVDASGRTIASKTTAFDIRKVLATPVNANEALSIPAGTAAGQYAVSVAVLNPETMLPGVALANNQKLADGSYAIGTVQVLSSPVILNPETPSTPVPAPVLTPIQTPVPEPVLTPIQTPVPAPVLTPVQTPVPAPVLTPVPAPSMALVPASISLYGASSLIIYSNKSTSQFNAVIQDINGTALNTETKSYSLAAPVAGVSINSKTGLVTILPSTLSGSFTISAKSVSTPTVIGKKTVTLVSKNAAVIPTQAPAPAPAPVPNSVLAPASITLYGADALTIYTGTSTSQYNAVIRNANGDGLNNEVKYYYLASPVSGVSVDSSTGLVTILPSTQPGSFTLSCKSLTSPSLFHSKTVTLVR